MNKVQLIGRLTADPELKTTSSGVNVCSFTLAVSRRFNRDETDFFPITVWREAAVNCNKYLSKGSQVAVSGSVQLRRYEDNNGVKRTAVDVQADEVEFLSARGDSANTSTNNTEVRVSELQAVDDNDEMPF